jgi:hypothetical protein
MEERNRQRLQQQLVQQQRLLFDGDGSQSQSQQESKIHNNQHSSNSESSQDDNQAAALLTNIEEEETDEEETWGDGFDDEEEAEEEKEEEMDGNRKDAATSSQGAAAATFGDLSPTMASNGQQRRAAAVAVVSPVDQQQQRTDAEGPTEKQRHLLDIHRSVELYLGHPIDIANMAHSRQPIRIGDYGGINSAGSSGKQSRRHCTGPYLEVVLAVCGTASEGTEHSNSGEEGTDEQDEDQEDADNHAVADANNEAPPTCATMMLVRMVNRIPLLDGAEASSCGLVQGLLQKKKIWNSFGLEVSSISPFDPHHQQQANHSVIPPQLPTFEVRDSDQVAPFFQSANHSRFENPFDEDDDESDDNHGNDMEEVGFSSSRRGSKRGRKKGRQWLLPARVRLGNILVIVQIDAEPSSLPLPTLSKVSAVQKI